MTAILILSVLGLLTLFVGVYKQDKLVLPIIFIGFIAAFIVNFQDWNVLKLNPDAHLLFHDYMHNMLRFDNYAIAFSGALMVLTFLVFLSVRTFYKTENAQVQEAS